MLKKLIATLCVAVALPIYAAERPDSQVERGERAAEAADKQESKAAAKTSEADKKTSEADKVSGWIKKAAKAGLAEVELGKLAAKQAESAEVKEFAKRMVDDHSKANEELMKIAKEKGVSPPTQLDKKHRKLQEELAQAKGAEFDKKYMAGQVKDHKNAIALFEKGAKSSDGDVQKFASSKLPALKEHLKMAEQVKPPRLPE